MLVATPGQNTSFVLHAKKSCLSNTNNSSAAGSNAISPTNIGNTTVTKTARHVLANCVKSAAAAVINAKQLKLGPLNLDHTEHQTNTTTSTNNNHTNNLSSIITSNLNTKTTNSNTSTSTLMKTLSVRLNRGTEFLKETVQKAFISKAPSSQINPVLNLYTVPPTRTHRFPTERLNVSSADSLHTEMCHFKPIRTEPKTPWKRNSKSRGASIKAPKACQATKVKLNCDDENADDEYLQFKPKPSSTLLTTIVTTPTHKSAFVCLIAQMKNISTEHHHDSTQSSMELHKTKSNRLRARSKCNTPISKSAINVPLNELILRKRRNPFVGVTKINIATELMTATKKAGLKSATAKTNITRAKSKVAVTRSKLPLKNNLENKKSNITPPATKCKSYKLYHCEVPEKQIRSRTRKSPQQNCKRKIVKVAGKKSFSRLSKRQSLMQSKRAAECFSPPLTRARLKRMSAANLQLVPALEFGKRGH